MVDIETKSTFQKFAVLSMDVEDWYHLDYFNQKNLDRSYSLLDGIDTYADLLDEFSVPSSFFVLSDIAQQVVSRLRELSSFSHDISCHGDDHVRPLLLKSKEFVHRTIDARQRLEDLLGISIPGYRASCFSLDRERLDCLINAGFLYDSSKISFGEHPLYGDLDVTGFKEVYQDVYQYGDFFEFEVSTLPIGKKRLPVSGGGYLRMFPWWLTDALLRRYLNTASLYVLYIHPFELSHRSVPNLDDIVSLQVKTRFSFGRSTTEHKLRKLVRMLKEHGFVFITFNDLRMRLLAESKELV
jgi:peptidoglycan/xylan/chitin deacetylase (PgdA/CDA1 family)